MSRDPNPHAPAAPGTFADAAERAVAAAERAVATAEVDPQHREQADAILGEALTALTTFAARIEDAQAHARALELTGWRDPQKAALAREAAAVWKRAVVRLEALGRRYRRADRRFTRPARQPGAFQRLIEWMAP